MYGNVIRKMFNFHFGCFGWQKSGSRFGQQKVLLLFGALQPMSVFVYRIKLMLQEFNNEIWGDVVHSYSGYVSASTIIDIASDTLHYRSILYTITTSNMLHYRRILYTITSNTLHYYSITSNKLHCHGILYSIIPLHTLNKNITLYRIT